MIGNDEHLGTNDRGGWLEHATTKYECTWVLIRKQRMTNNPRVKQLVRRAAASGIGERILRLLAEPPVGGVDWSTLRRPIPVSRWFGSDRGQPLDRVFIERFLEGHACRIHGAVLEIAEDTYTRRFGGEAVRSIDVLHAIAGNPAATIVADLTDAPTIADGTYDCIVITQTLQMIYDLPAAVRTLHRILKPGGSILATLPGISQVSRSDMEKWGDYWRFTSASARRTFEEAFPSSCISLQVYGSVLTATAFLHGLARDDLTEEELSFCDPDYQLLIGVHAEKRA
jgi:SAM-dependent methyltransferase